MHRRLPHIRAEMAEVAGNLASSELMRGHGIDQLEALEPHTQKADRLMSLLSQVNGAEGKKGIVFVKQIALLHPLAQLCEERDLRVAKVGGVSSMTELDRNEALKRFKRGQVSVLISTDAVEEVLRVLHGMHTL